jgi:hypothetical protein
MQTRADEGTVKAYSTDPSREKSKHISMAKSRRQDTGKSMSNTHKQKEQHEQEYRRPHAIHSSKIKFLDYANAEKSIEPVPRRRRWALMR